MNYLAHALLSQHGSRALLGNIAGDHVKGPLDAQGLHPQLLAGVRRHRAVDVLSDGHAASCALRALFPNGERRFAGLLRDVLFDHLLTQHWGRFCSTPPAAFRAEVYAAIEAHADCLPPGFAALAPRWVAVDWLGAYARFDGTVAVLERLSARARRPLPLPAMLDTAECHWSALQDGFLALFTDLAAAFADDRRHDLLL